MSKILEKKSETLTKHKKKKEKGNNKSKVYFYI